MRFVVKLCAFVIIKFENYIRFVSYSWIQQNADSVITRKTLHKAITFMELKLYHYVIGFFVLVVFLTGFIVQKNYTEEKQLYKEYSGFIQGLEKDVKSRLGKTEHFDDSTVTSYYFKNAIQVKKIEKLGEKTTLFYLNTKLFAKACDVNNKKYLTIQYFRPDGSMFAIEYSVFNLKTLITFFDRNSNVLGNENIALPPYIIYVLYSL
jgi:hypothetical protein